MEILIGGIASCPKAVGSLNSGFGKWGSPPPSCLSFSAGGPLNFLLAALTWGMGGTHVLYVIGVARLLVTMWKSLHGQACARTCLPT